MEERMTVLSWWRGYESDHSLGNYASADTETDNYLTTVMKSMVHEHSWSLCKLEALATLPSPTCPQRQHRPLSSCPSCPQRQKQSFRAYIMTVLKGSHCTLETRQCLFQLSGWSDFSSDKPQKFSTDNASNPLKSRLFIHSSQCISRVLQHSLSRFPLSPPFLP